MSRINCKTILQVIIVLIPFAIFGATYFLLGKWPNYLFNDVDVKGLYETEKQLFGIATASGTLTPCEYFHVNHCALLDILSGLFYLCWVPLPVLYAIVLQLQGHSKTAIHFSSAFLMCNLIGFCGYYIHPASPPWYVMQHGFDVIIGTPGNVAGFENFDQLVGIPVFANIYNKNANVFAAVPSLHAAYNVVAFWYAMQVKDNRLWQAFIGIVAVGICFSAVYSGHHYVIDVTLGILTAILGILTFELCVSRITPIYRFYNRITSYLTINK